MAAVDEDGELDGARPADVAEGVEGGADGAAGEEHVVDEDDQTAVDAVTGDLGAAEGTGGLQPQVVPVHGDVEGTDRDLGAGDRFELLGEPAGEEDTAGGNAEENHVVRALGALDDLVCDAGEDPRDVRGLENGPRVIAVLLLGVHEETDLLLRLTGRLLKDVGFAPSTLPGTVGRPARTPVATPRTVPQEGVVRTFGLTGKSNAA